MERERGVTERVERHREGGKGAGREEGREREWDKREIGREGGRERVWEIEIEREESERRERKKHQSSLISRTQHPNGSGQQTQATIPSQPRAAGEGPRRRPGQKSRP